MLFRFIALSLLLPAFALAGQGVPSPYVTPDHRITVTDGYYRADSPDEAELRQRLSYDSTITNHTTLRRRIVFQDDAQGDFSFREAEFAAIHQLTQTGDYWLDTGLYGGLHFREDSVGFTGRVLLAKRWSDYEFRSNILLRGDVDEGAERFWPEFRWRLSRRFEQDDLAVGIEYFSRYQSFEELNFRDALHQIGPVIVKNFAERRYYSEFGTVFGLNENTEAALIKWRVGVRF